GSHQPIFTSRAIFGSKSNAVHDQAHSTAHIHSRLYLVPSCLETIFPEMPSASSNAPRQSKCKPLFSLPYRSSISPRALLFSATKCAPPLTPLIPSISKPITRLKQKSTNPVDVFVDKIFRWRWRWMNVASRLRAHITTITKPRNRAALSLCHHFYAIIASNTSM
ncbi:hypothetical protein EDB84DRAFT_1501212, partial [Lactarius hengduanensis]